jgi:SAM-dependent methyltransferase
MPFSNSEQISPIFAEIKRVPTHSVLDVGCGFGVYGMLCRVYLDFYNDEKFYDKFEGKPYDIRIDGIEGTGEYIPWVPRFAYDGVQEGDALELLAGKHDQEYDLVLALAIIEHFDKADGKRFLDQLKRVGRRVIVSVPKNVQPQNIPGKPYETHRSHWNEADFRQHGYTRFLPHDLAWIAVYDPMALSLSDTSDTKHDRSGVLSAIEQTNALLAQMLEQQQMMNSRLSLSARAASLMDRVKRFFGQYRAVSRKMG